jgi:DNA-binding transcriptional regulator GbsR (MarR family)
MLDSRIHSPNHSGGTTEHSHLAEQLDESSREFINNLGRVADFFGFNRLMGQLYAVLFLSPEPLTLDDMVRRLDSSKGNVSINIRNLERLGLVRQIYKWADRKNYYEAETNIWKAVSGILQERERRENQNILKSLSSSMDRLKQVASAANGPEVELADFYLKRMEVLRTLFEFGDYLLDKMVRGGLVDFNNARRKYDTEESESGEPEIVIIEMDEEEE